jgi:hypothetical protein
VSDRNKQAARAAAAIHESFVQARNVPVQISLPDSLWQECERLARRIQRARQHNWVLAARRLCQSLHQNLCILDRRVNDVSSTLAHGQTDVRLASTREIYRDLVALQHEFSDVECNLKRHTISVVTEEITLEGVELGRFEIILDLRCLDENQPYEVTAVDSNPATSNADVTHPHVEAGSLCEGDGRAAIRAALSQGRLLDFFVLVRQILGTYNSGSAYVRLEDWHGTDCRDCGRLVHEDDRGTCERCECNICNDCVTRCTRCNQYCCADCSGTCEDCGDPFCSPCLSKCPNCRLLFCDNCLNDGICHACTETEEEENDEPTPTGQGSGNDQQTDAQVHPVRVGQAAVLA